jgi:hypothetical protein
MTRSAHGRQSSSCPTETPRAVASFSRVAVLISLSEDSIWDKADWVIPAFWATSFLPRYQIIINQIMTRSGPLTLHSLVGLFDKS